MKVVIANFSAPQEVAGDFSAYWAEFEKPACPGRANMYEYPVGWGFHILALGMHLLDLGIAREVEFWDYAAARRCAYDRYGILRLDFYNAPDLAAYMERFGAPDLFINYGREGVPILQTLEGKSFRVHVPCLRTGMERTDNYGAECYLVDDEQFLDASSMLYVPVVNTRKLVPSTNEKMRDFVYIAQARGNKRHDILLDAVRGTTLTGHLHPVNAGQLDLTGTFVTTSAYDEREVLELLETSCIAVYPGDNTSNPAALWECIAAGLPIVVNANIAGGKHAVVAGVTGEFAAPDNFRAVMERVLAHREAYQPREYFLAHWDTKGMLNSYLEFFRRMGWSG